MDFHFLVCKIQIIVIWNYLGHLNVVMSTWENGWMESLKNLMVWHQQSGQGFHNYLRFCGKIASWQHFRNLILKLSYSSAQIPNQGLNPTNLALLHCLPQDHSSLSTTLPCDQRTPTSDTQPEPQPPIMSLVTDSLKPQFRFRNLSSVWTTDFSINKGISGDCQKEFLCNGDRILKASICSF